MDKKKTPIVFPTKIFCRKCKQSTKHAILHKESTSEYWKDVEIGVSSEYFTLQCMGCESVCLLEEYSCSEDIHPVTGEYDITTKIYPSPFKARKETAKVYHLPSSIKEVYLECVMAINTKLPILSAIGIRTVIEAICNDKEVEGRNLEQKIDGLVKKGLMTKDGAELLHLTRVVGNFSAHEMKRHNSEDLGLCLDIVETVLQNTYILPIEAERMKKPTQKRN